METVEGTEITDVVSVGSRLEVRGMIKYWPDLTQREGPQSEDTFGPWRACRDLLMHKRHGGGDRKTVNA